MAGASVLGCETLLIALSSWVGGKSVAKRFNQRAEIKGKARSAQQRKNHSSSIRQLRQTLKSLFSAEAAICAGSIDNGLSQIASPACVPGIRWQSFPRSTTKPVRFNQQR